MSSSVKVLVVDDEPSLLELAKLFLERDGSIAVDTTTSALEALSRLDDNGYDAVVSDFQMPEMDGIDLLKRVRDLWTDIPFILFTGKGREDVAITALNLGADFYIQKGGEPKAQFAELENMISQAVGRRRADALRRDVDERYRNFVKNFRGIAYQANHDESRLVFFDGTVEEMTGYGADDFLSGRVRWDNLIHPEDRQRFMKRFKELSTQSDCVTDDTYRIVRDDGEIRWVTDTRQLTTKAVKDKKVVQGVIQDITEKVVAKAQLEESEQRYRDIISMARDGIWVISPDGATTLVNQTMAQMLGYTAHEMVGRNLFDFMDDEHKASATALMERRRSGVAEQHEFEFLRKDGTTLHADLATCPVQDGKGNFAGALAIVTDVSDKPTREKVMFDEVERMKVLLDGIGECIYVADPETHDLVFANQAFKGRFGEWQGRKCHEVIHGLREPCDFCTNTLVLGQNLGNTHMWLFQSEKGGKVYKCIDRAVAWPDGRYLKLELAVDVTSMKEVDPGL